MRYTQLYFLAHAHGKLKLLSPWLFVHGARSAAERARVIEALSKAFAAPEPDLEAARNFVIELRYLDNIEQVCREWQPGKRVELQH